MGQPGERRVARAAVDGSATGEVEGALGEEGLATSGRRHQAGGDRLGQPLDLERLGAAGDILGRVGAEEHLAEVDADPGGEGDAVADLERGQGAVVGERVVDGVDRPLEQQQEAVGLVDLEAGVVVEEVAGEAVMGAEDGKGALVAQPFDQRRAGDQVAHQERFENSLGAAPGSCRAGHHPRIVERAGADNRRPPRPVRPKPRSRGAPPERAVRQRADDVPH